LGFREHFFVVNEIPHLACVLSWQDAVVSEADLAAARELRAHPVHDLDRRPIPSGDDRRGRQRRDGRREGPDPTAGLDERERALFNTLRDWRSRKAHEEGILPGPAAHVGCVTGVAWLSPYI